MTFFFFKIVSPVCKIDVLSCPLLNRSNTSACGVNLPVFTSHICWSTHFSRSSPVAKFWLLNVFQRIYQYRRATTQCMYPEQCFFFWRILDPESGQGVMEPMHLVVESFTVLIHYGLGCADSRDVNLHDLWKLDEKPLLKVGIPLRCCVYASPWCLQRCTCWQKQLQWDVFHSTCWTCMCVELHAMQALLLWWLTGSSSTICVRDLKASCSGSYMVAEGDSHRMYYSSPLKLYFYPF
jgi:hypothetical protein